MNRFRHIALTVLLLVSPLCVKAGDLPDSLRLRYDTFATLCSPEKVYLHYDRSCYTAGETIWFRGWVQEASRFSVLPPSNFIYAEVLDGHGQAVARVKIKRTDEGFPGCIELPDNLETGNYTIRAYTLWQLNNADEYLFNDSVRIIGGKENPADSAPAESSGLEISFWPEGGRYFAGQNSVIGFKAVDGQGRSLDFEGALVSDTNGESVRVSTTHDGMGVFAFRPEPGHNYSIQDDSGRLHPLPAPSTEGATLQLQIHSDRYYISAIGFGGGEASLLLRDASELRPVADVELDGTVGSLMMKKSVFNPGINHLLLVDSRGMILAERLFFIRDDEAPVCGLEMEHLDLAPRAQLSGYISLNMPDGTPLDGNCSVSVVRGALKDWHQSDGIVSYMGLSSELKGRINNPYYYFNPEISLEERDAALDILMMIQGWRYYDVERIIDIKGGIFKNKYARERIQEIRGHISRRHSSRMPKNFTFTFMIPRWNDIHSVEVDQGRLFVIDSLDFPENTEMLINIGTSRLGAHYIPKWDGDPAAGPFVYKPAPGYARAARILAPMLNEMASDDTLQAAVVTASYREDDVLVFGRSYREDLETYKEMTLVEYLSMKKAVFEYDGENMYNRNKRRGNSFDDDSFESFGEENESGKVKLIVDDSEAPWWSYDMLHLEDLRSISISTQADPVYGGDGGVVHITVKPGGRYRNMDRNPSLLYFVPLGYQEPRYFDAPCYDGDDNRPYDLRNTIWWSPSVAISGGRVPISFFNSDRTDFPYLIRIEGISADGRPFSCHRLIGS